MTRLDPERLEHVLRNAASIRVAVVGDLMLDVYLSGSVTRISPEAPVPVVHVHEESFALGGAANVVANVAALGARCDVVGFVGRDEGADSIRSALRALEGAEVTPRLVERADRPTTTKTRVMARKHQVVRFDRERDDDLPQDCADELLDAVLREVVVPLPVEAHHLVLPRHDARLGGSGAVGTFHEPGRHPAALDGAQRIADGLPPLVLPHEAHHVAVGAETGHVRHDVRRAAEREVLFVHVHHRHRRLRRDPGDRPAEVHVEHEIADHRDADGRRALQHGLEPIEG